MRPRVRCEVREPRGSDQSRFEKELLGDNLERRGPYLNCSALRVATDKAATTASDARTKPFLHGLACDPDALEELQASGRPDRLSIRTGGIE